MAEIKITFDLTFNRRFLRAVGIFGIMFCAVPELDSESVTLSTYYPAPSGVYTQMITTGNTYLSRDTGRVGIGTAAPTYKLDVTGVGRTSAGFLTTYVIASGSVTAGGAFNADNSDIYFRDAAHTHTGIGNTVNYAAIENASDYDTLMILGRSGGMGQAAGYRTVGLWDRLDVNGHLKVTGPAQLMQGSLGSCSNASHTYAPGGGTFTMCAAGRYVTMIDGVYSKTYVIPNSNDSTTAGASSSYEVNARCCLCPTGGCAGM